MDGSFALPLPPGEYKLRRNGIRQSCRNHREDAAFEFTVKQGEGAMSLEVPVAPAPPAASPPEEKPAPSPAGK